MDDIGEIITHMKCNSLFSVLPEQAIASLASDAYLQTFGNGQMLIEGCCADSPDFALRLRATGLQKVYGR